MIKNFIQINGNYIEQKNISDVVQKDISQQLAIKLADGFGYEKMDEKTASGQSA